MSAFPTADEHKEEFTPSTPSSDLFPSGLLQLMMELQEETDSVKRDNLTFGILARHSSVIALPTGTPLLKMSPQPHFSQLVNCIRKLCRVRR